MSCQLIRRVTIVAVGVTVLATSCTFPFFPTPSPGETADMGTLTVDIDYTGTWYRETFDYSREAANIRHYVLVMPESEMDRASAGEIFVTFGFLTSPDEPMINRDGEDISWTRDYLYEAPAGYFTGEFAPGTYYVAVAFIAAALSREEAGVSEDVILYPGVTGGGASTDYKGIVIEAGETADVKFILTDANGWACPWLYVYDGCAFVRRTEILRSLRGKQNEQTEVSPIGVVPVVDGAITLKITEEKREITFIDEVTLIVDGVEIRAEAEPVFAAKVSASDQDYLILASGQSYAFRFRLPAAFASLDQADVSIAVTGFYVPLD
jgi:hypothetical protein